MRWLALQEYEVLLLQLARASRQAVFKGHGGKKSPLGPHLSHPRVPYPVRPTQGRGFREGIRHLEVSPLVREDFLKEAAKKFGIENALY